MHSLNALCIHLLASLAPLTRNACSGCVRSTKRVRLCSQARGRRRLLGASAGAAHQPRSGARVAPVLVRYFWRTTSCLQDVSLCMHASESTRNCTRTCSTRRHDDVALRILAHHEKSAGCVPLYARAHGSLVPLHLSLCTCSCSLKSLEPGSPRGILGRD